MGAKEIEEMKKYIRILKTELSHYKTRIQKIDSEDNVLVWIPSWIYTTFGGRANLVECLRETSTTLNKTSSQVQDQDATLEEAPDQSKAK